MDSHPNPRLSTLVNGEIVDADPCGSGPAGRCRAEAALCRAAKAEGWALPKDIHGLYRASGRARLPARHSPGRRRIPAEPWN